MIIVIEVSVIANYSLESMADASDLPIKRPIEGPAQGPVAKRGKADEEDDNVSKEEVDSKCTSREIVGNKIQKVKSFFEKSGKSIKFLNKLMLMRQKQHTIR